MALLKFSKRGGSSRLEYVIFFFGLSHMPIHACLLPSFRTKLSRSFTTRPSVVHKLRKKEKALPPNLIELLYFLLSYSLTPTGIGPRVRAGSSRGDREEEDPHGRGVLPLRRRTANYPPRQRRLEASYILLMIIVRRFVYVLGSGTVSQLFQKITVVEATQCYARNVPKHHKRDGGKKCLYNVCCR